MKSMLFLALLAMVGVVTAEHIPTSSIGYQGTLELLRNPDKVTFGNPIEVRFYLYRSPDASADELPLWGRRVNVTTDENGSFAVTLNDEDGMPIEGSTQSLADILATQGVDEPLYLTFSAGTSTSQLHPRQAIYAVPKAHLAHTASGAKDGFKVSGTLHAVSAEVVDTTTLRTALKTKVLTVTTTEAATIDGNLTIGEGIPTALTAEPLTANETITFGANTEGGVLFPIGSIVMWYPQDNNRTPPEGWVICDGQDSNCPPLAKRFLVGEDSSKADYKKWGKTGGSETVSLSEHEMPEHSHSLSYENRKEECKPTALIKGKGDECAWYGSEVTEKATTETNKSLGKAHNNLPSYHELYFIQRVK